MLVRAHLTCGCDVYWHEQFGYEQTRGYKVPCQLHGLVGVASVERPDARPIAGNPTLTYLGDGFSGQCPCGWQVGAGSRDFVMEQLREHALYSHNHRMDARRVQEEAENDKLLRDQLTTLSAHLRSKETE